MTVEARNTQRTILVVDDDPDYLLQQRLQLEAAGYSVREAENTDDARQLLKEQLPDLVILDLMMEEEDSGFRLCYEIKKNHPQLPVIMVTAVESETGINFETVTGEERMWIKADVVLDKPVRFEQLEREIGRLLKG